MLQILTEVETLLLITMCGYTAAVGTDNEQCTGTVLHFECAIKCNVSQSTN